MEVYTYTLKVVKGKGGLVGRVYRVCGRWDVRSVPGSLVEESKLDVRYSPP